MKINIQMAFDDSGFVAKADRFFDVCVNPEKGITFPEALAKNTVIRAKSIIHDYEPGGESASIWDTTGKGSHSEGSSNVNWESYRSHLGMEQPEPGKLRNSLNYNITEKTPSELTVGIFNTANMPEYWYIQEYGGMQRMGAFEYYIISKQYIRNSLDFAKSIFKKTLNSVCNSAMVRANVNR